MNYKTKRRKLIQALQKKNACIRRRYYCSRETITLYSDGIIMKGRTKESIVDDGVIHSIRQFLDYKKIDYHTCELTLKKDFDISMLKQKRKRRKKIYYGNCEREY